MQPLNKIRTVVQRNGYYTGRKYATTCLITTTNQEYEIVVSCGIYIYIYIYVEPYYGKPLEIGMRNW